MCIHSVNARIYNAGYCIRLSASSFHTFLLTFSEIAELTEFERGIIIGGWLFGHTEREIEAKTGHPKSTVHDIIERYCETGAGSSRPRSGRPPILTDRDKRHIVRIVPIVNNQQAQKKPRNCPQNF